MAYHHGDLRRALLTAAAEAIVESGPAALSLRDLARRAGVSHAAPTHHFGDKKGLLTVLATEGFEELSAALNASWERDGSLLELGVSYVHFAVTHRAHFEVMFRPDLFHDEDAGLVAARGEARGALKEGGLSGWSIAHGFATLWNSGALSHLTGTPEAAAREVLCQLSP
ncbi:TetR/AcrR family transcriptional regulator [Winogradskya consettensis]|uniref:TetR/AcrR family transcriptional regulator n=1 Tax=Winogradskya consettensis TaxID=113560 RepID=UPI001BB35FBF|nr:TetR/AcrR family transcriptional regulator [Actinoplanes consettensis]